LDFSKALRTDRRLKEMAKARHLVVRFGLTGAIHVQRRMDSKGLQSSESDKVDDLNVTLYYDPLYSEGGFRDQEKYGRVFGLTALLTANIARSVADGLITKDGSGLADWITTGLLSGMLNSRHLYCHGFGYADLSSGRPVSVALHI
jgi:hypothetical protein